MWIGANDRLAGSKPAPRASTATGGVDPGAAVVTKRHRKACAKRGVHNVTY